MTTAARLCLICLVLATSLALGVARGQLSVAGMETLCSGSTVIVADEGGSTPGTRRICPDAAPLFLAWVSLPAPAPTAGPARFDRLVPAPVMIEVLLRDAGSRARGPPRTTLG